VNCSNDSKILRLKWSLLVHQASLQKVDLKLILTQVVLILLTSVTAGSNVERACMYDGYHFIKTDIGST